MDRRTSTKEKQRRAAHAPAGMRRKPSFKYAMEEREATRRLSTTTVASSELSGLYEILTQWNGEVADPEMAASWAPRAAPRWAPFCGRRGRGHDMSISRWSCAPSGWAKVSLLMVMGSDRSSTAQTTPGAGCRCVLALGP